jgi:uncharacterized protein YkwD
MNVPDSTRAPRAPLLALFATLLLLISCAAGGGDAAVAASPAAAAPRPAATAASTCNINNFAAAALARINRVRAAGADCHSGGVFAPAAALVWNTRLTHAASAHSAEMAAKNYFSHASSDGRTMASRVNATGYSWSALPENIAAGQVGIDKLVDGWVASDGHCANLMNPRFSEVGLACVPGTSNNSYSTYWTMDLSRPR